MSATAIEILLWTFKAKPAECTELNNGGFERKKEDKCFFF